MSTRRSMPRYWMALWAASLLGNAACEGKPQVTEQRRELLRPPDRRAIRDEERRMRAIFDEEGEVLPSETRVAGVLLPKGLEQGRTFPGEWYFHTERVPAEKLVTYFKRRLFPQAIERSKTGAVTFRVARIRDAPKAPPLTVRVAPLEGSPSSSKVYMRQPQPVPKKYPTGREAEAQLEALRKFRD